MDLQNKLDEDFVFYLGFVRRGSTKFKQNSQEYNICQAWLQKLCGDIANTVYEKTNRNIFLAHLVQCFEEGKLTGPFTQMPPNQLADAAALFEEPAVPVIKEPTWLSELLEGKDDDEVGDASARTYLATKSLPDGRGALGYIAISLDDEMPRMKGEMFDEHMERKFRELVPPISEMERILINRKVPEERQKILDFYSLVIQNVAKEIDGKIPPGSNVQTAALIQQLITSLKQKGEFDKYEAMDPTHQHLELLFLLDSRLQERVMHIKKREFFLDNIEKGQVNTSFFETSLKPEDIYKDERTGRAGKMWTEAINSGPSQKLIREIHGKYPPFIIKKFLDLLATEKEKIALKIQRRHENVFSQLKKELRKEGEKGKKKFEKTKLSHDEILSVKNAVLAAENNAYESYQKRKEYLTGHRKERDELYEEVRNTMLETQERVEEEAAFGRYLTEQINTVAAQAEVYQHVNEESLQKAEDENIVIMKNIQRLSRTIKQHENRITNMRQILAKSAVESGSKFFYV